MVRKLKIQKYGSRNWSVYDNSGNLICVTVYKKGAVEVAKRLSDAGADNYPQLCLNLDEITKLHKELKTINQKFTNMIKQFKATENTPQKAVLYNQNFNEKERLNNGTRS